MNGLYDRILNLCKNFKQPTSMIFIPPQCRHICELQRNAEGMIIPNIDISEKDYDHVSRVYNSNPVLNINGTIMALFTIQGKVSLCIYYGICVIKSDDIRVAECLERIIRTVWNEVKICNHSIRFFAVINHDGTIVMKCKSQVIDFIDNAEIDEFDITLDELNRIFSIMSNIDAQMSFMHEIYMIYVVNVTNITAGNEIAFISIDNMTI